MDVGRCAVCEVPVYAQEMDEVEWEKGAFQCGYSGDFYCKSHGAAFCGDAKTGICDKCEDGDDDLYEEIEEEENADIDISMD